MSATLQALPDLKHILKEDADSTCPRHSILPKSINQQAVCDVTQNMINASPTLATLSGNVSFASVCPEGFVGIGPIGTDAFIQHFVEKT
jgi:hypothetical protein